MYKQTYSQNRKRVTDAYKKLMVPREQYPGSEDKLRDQGPHVHTTIYKKTANSRNQHNTVTRLYSNKNYFTE